MNPWPDIEAILVEVLAVHGNTGTETPDDLQDQLEFIRVNLVPGGSSDDINDFPRVQVNLFAGTRAVGAPLAETIRQQLLAGPIVGAAGQIDRTISAPPPVEMEWSDPNIRWWLTTYQFAARRVPSI
jgi:hypothetical protein